MSWATLGSPDVHSFPDAQKRATAIRENISRKGQLWANGAWAATTKTQFSSITLIANDVVTALNFAVGTAAPTVTHSMAGLYDGSLNLIRQSIDTLTVGFNTSAINAVTLDSLPVTAGARVASAVVTLTFPTLSQSLLSLIAVNDSVVVSNANIAAYNGTFTVTGVTATTITYTSGGSATDSLASPFPTVQLAAGKRTFTVPSTGNYYAAVAQVGTVNSFVTVTSAAVGTVVSGIAPITTGQDATTVIAGTLASPAVALTAGILDPYLFIT